MSSLAWSYIASLGDGTESVEVACVYMKAEYVNYLH